MWTYGVVVHVDDDEVTYELAELYHLDVDGNLPIQGYCAPFLISDSIEGLREILKKMLDALDVPKIIEAKEVEDE